MDELSALVPHASRDPHAVIVALRERGVGSVWLRLGARGSLLATAEGEHELDAFPTEVIDVTGAGDAMLAGYAFALVRGASAVEAARYGHAAAAITVASARTVSENMSAAAVEAIVGRVR